MPEHQKSTASLTFPGLVGGASRAPLLTFRLGVTLCNNPTVINQHFTRIVTRQNPALCNRLPLCHNKPLRANGFRRKKVYARNLTSCRVNFPRSHNNPKRTNRYSRKKVYTVHLRNPDFAKTANACFFPFYIMALAKSLHNVTQRYTEKPCKLFSFYIRCYISVPCDTEEIGLFP